jgi:hypothetical protein
MEMSSSDHVSSACFSARFSAPLSSRCLSAAICFCANVSIRSRAMWRSRSCDVMFSLRLSPACGFGVPTSSSRNSIEQAWTRPRMSIDAPACSSLRDWISSMNVLVCDTFLKYDVAIGSSLCSTSCFTLPKRCATIGALR